MEYKIITGTDPERFQKQVQDVIDNFGYRPLGACQTNALATPQGVIVVFTQTLTKGGVFTLNAE